MQVLKVPTGPAVLDLLPVLARALEGQGPALLPVPADDDRASARLVVALSGAPGDADPDDGRTALVVTTSGSTGVPRGVLLGAAALRASGTATHHRLDGPGTWLLALPAHHVAGLQVLLRSVLAGTEPAVLPARPQPGDLAAAIAAMPGPRRYTSLVPTQLVRALEHPADTAALTDLDAVLLGGAATPPALRARALAAGVPVVRTYGMSETCGGCVYDGVPLDGVVVRLDGARVLLGGATLAHGYLGRPEHPAFAEPGWFRTDDVGRLDAEGRLAVLGRADDAITTGGLTVAPQVVEAALSTHPDVRECVVLGVADATWGQRVVAVVVPGANPPTLDQLREHVGRTLDRSAAPRELHLRDALPLRGPGKVDRRALLAELGGPRRAGGPD